MGIPVEISAQQCESAVLDISFWLPQLDPKRQGEGRAFFQECWYITHCVVSVGGVVWILDPCWNPWDLHLKSR